MDLRDKLSGVASQNHQTTQAQEAPKVQRRVASVVFNSSNVTQGVASTTAPAPVSVRPTATAKRPSAPMVLYTIPLCLDFRDVVFSILCAQSLKIDMFELIRPLQVIYCLLFFRIQILVYSFASLVSLGGY